MRADELIPEIATYAHLTNQLMGADIDPPHHPKTRWHLNRTTATHLPARVKSKSSERWRNYLWRLRARVYYYAKLPGWIWQNTRGSPHDAFMFEKLACFARKMLDPRFSQGYHLTSS